MPVVAGLLFILFNKSFPQEGAIAASSSTEAFRDYVSRQIIAGTDSANVEIPVITLLKEPVFTQSDSNVVFWNTLGEKVQVSWGEFNLKGCVIEVQSASDSGFTRDLIQLAKEKYPSGNADHVTIKDRYIGKRYYQARLWIPGNTPDPYDVVSGPWSAPVSTTLDVAPPTCDSLAVYQQKNNLLQPANRYGWFNSPSIRINFYGLQDPAGIDSAFIEGDIKAGTRFFPRKLDGDPGSTPVDGVFPFELVNDKYGFSFGAKDAAYTPESHAANWALGGNRKGVIFADTIQIDAQKPVIKLDAIEAVYSSSNKEADGSISLEVIITDNLSGVNVESVKIISNFTFDKIEKQAFDLKTCVVTLTAADVQEDVSDTLTVSAEDYADNESSATTTFQFIVEAPKLESFRLSDLNFGEDVCLVPAEGFTNSSIVRIDNLKLKDGSKPAAFLNICCGKNCVRKPWPVSGSLEVDLQNELMVDLNAVKEITITVNAEDGHGNKQTDGPSKSIEHDNTPPVIELTVQSPHPVDSDARNGAFPGWTRDRTVQVQISTNEPLFKIDQLDPETLCREGSALLFPVELPAANQQYPFSYQSGDSAGNASNIASTNIRLDTDIFQPVIADFEYGDDLFRDGFIKICFLKPDNIPNRSRIVVNNTLYSFGADACVAVPADTNGYIVSIIDFAGNETDPDTLPPPCPKFGIKLVDNLANSRAAVDGFTNDAVIQWDITSPNFIWSKLDSMTFCNESGDKCVTLKPDERALDLSKLYNPPVSGTNYTLKAKANVRNWPQCDPVFYASYTIIYDTDHPVIDGFTLHDLKDDPFAAESGFTNDEIIELHVQADTLGVDSIEIEGMANDKVDGKYLPAVFPWKSSYSVELDTADEFKAHEFKGTVWDKAGNSGAPSIASINYLEQSIAIETAVDTLVRADSDTEPEEVLITVNCNYPDYLTQSRVTDPLGIVQPKPIKWKSAGQQGAGTQREAVVEIDVSVKGNYSIVFVDAAGNGSNEDSIYIKKQSPPIPLLTLFDYSEFPQFNSPAAQLPPDWERSDSLFTDNDSNGQLVALTRLKKGDWDSIRIAPRSMDKLREAPYSPVADPDSSVDLRTVLLPADIDSIETIKYYVQVKNLAGMEAADSCEIIFDDIAPQLTYFNGLPIVSDSLGYKISYRGGEELPGEVAGLVVKEVFGGNEKSSAATKTQFKSIENSEGEIEINLLPYSGSRKICAYLVDKADVDQNRGDSDGIDHPSDTLCIEVRLNPEEISNYPNPFNPSSHDDKMKVTKLLFYAKDDSKVRISILNPFGNLVKEWQATCQKDMNDGDSNDLLRWDGTNDKGDIVANGGYICIIDVLKTGERYTRKIAVLKHQNSNVR